MGSAERFEVWLRKVCFQAPPQHAYDLARDAWMEAEREAAERMRERCVRMAYDCYMECDTGSGCANCVGKYAR